MEVYYIYSNINKNKYNFLDIKESNKSINDLQNIILYTPNFCRDNQSITTNELKNYIRYGITFFTSNSLNQITGLINFDINQTTLNILGICVPGLSKGIGSYLINLVKQFAKANNLQMIKLTCYDNLKYFYLKQQFKVINESTFYDSDEEDENSKTRYDMVFDLNSFKGGKSKKSKKSKKTIKKRQMKRKYSLSKKNIYKNKKIQFIY
jgi:hypothetical protein